MFGMERQSENASPLILQHPEVKALEQIHLTGLGHHLSIVSRP